MKHTEESFEYNFFKKIKEENSILIGFFKLIQTKLFICFSLFFCVFIFSENQKRQKLCYCED